MWVAIIGNWETPPGRQDQNWPFTARTKKHKILSSLDANVRDKTHRSIRHILLIQFFFQVLYNLHSDKKVKPDSRTEPDVHPAGWVRKVGRVKTSLSFNVKSSFFSSSLMKRYRRDVMLAVPRWHHSLSPIMYLWWHHCCYFLVRGLMLPTWKDSMFFFACER